MPADCFVILLVVCVQSSYIGHEQCGQLVGNTFFKAAFHFFGWLVYGEPDITLKKEDQLQLWNGQKIKDGEMLFEMDRYQPYP